MVEFFHADDVLDFLREEIALDLRGQDLDNRDRWFFVVVRNDHGAVIGVMVFEAKTSFDWHMSIAFAEGATIPAPRLLTLTWRTVFTRAVRVTMLIDPDNERSEQQARRLGAVYEGFLRKGLDGRRDALLFGMLQEDCRYLRPRQAARQGPQNDNPEVRIH